MLPEDPVLGQALFGINSGRGAGMTFRGAAFNLFAMNTDGDVRETQDRLKVRASPKLKSL
jgi:hypothetical protein